MRLLIRLHPHMAKSRRLALCDMFRSLGLSLAIHKSSGLPSLQRPVQKLHPWMPWTHNKWSSNWHLWSLEHDLLWKMQIAVRCMQMHLAQKRKEKTLRLCNYSINLIACNEKAVRETDFSHSLIRGEKRVIDEAEASGRSFLIHWIVYRLKC